MAKTKAFLAIRSYIPSTGLSVFCLDKKEHESRGECIFGFIPNSIFLVFRNLKRPSSFIIKEL